VSFGGLIVVDDKTFGMTVHHFLDDPDAEGYMLQELQEAPPLRSSVASQGLLSFSYLANPDSLDEDDESEDKAMHVSDEGAIISASVLGPTVRCLREE
jgi:hypothetical protein